MLGFLIGVSIAVFVVGTIYIVNRARDKKANKDKNIKKGDSKT